jgi:ferredoxin
VTDRVDQVEIRIDDTVCMGIGVCVETEPEAVRLGDDGVSRPVPHYRLSRDRALNLCQGCPSGAISIASSDAGPAG